MRAIREITGGLMLALITTCTVLGGILLAFRETGLALVSGTAIVEVTTAVTASRTTVIIEPTNSPVPTATPPASPTRTATLQSTDTRTPTPTETAVPTRTQTSAATQTATSSRTFTLTPLPTATAQPPNNPSPTPCGPPFNWVQYTVQPGDTLFQLAQRFGVSMQSLRSANCLPNNNLQAGQVIFVPFVPATPTQTPTATVVPTETPVPQPLAILNIVLVNSEADPSRPNGAIAYIFVEVSGGAAPYTFYDEEIPQASNPMPIKTDCGATVLHTVRVLSADGQNVSQAYGAGPVNCP